jgi:hypothetical protein
MTNNTHIPSSWVNWIAENQARGVAEADIAEVLAANGFDPQFAQQEVLRRATQPDSLVAAGTAQRLGKLEALMSIYSELWRGPGSWGVDRVSEIDSDVFFRWYYSTNRPVVLKDRMKNWAALQRWTPDYLRARCGDEVVEVMMGRTGDPQYEINCERHKTSMCLSRFVDLVESAGDTNDFYMVANNRTLESGNMRVLLNEIDLFDGILDPARTAARLFLWFGPAGTVTPLHHDSMNVLLAQVLGRKVVTLIPSFETPLVYNHVGVYSEVDYEAPDYDRYPLFRNVSSLEVVLQPGEALFIPVGWWHHVRSLDVSISVSFTNFLAPNDYAWEGRGYGS